MARNNHFISPTRQPLLDHPQAVLLDDYVGGALRWCNPTRARFNLHSSKTRASDGASDPPSTSNGDSSSDPLANAQVEWRTRDSRKGRHVLRIPVQATKASDTPRLSTDFRVVLKNIWRMCTVFAWWDISWWIGVLFSVGSAIFVVSGLFYWLPIVAPSTEFPRESLYGGGITSFIGATFFQAGAVLLIVEAVNEGQTACFGWALEQVVSDPSESNANETGSSKTSIAKPTKCLHHHARGLHHISELPRPNTGRQWQWWPTWHELTTHYFHEIGFLASGVLALGSTVFYVSGIMALPGIVDKISTPVLWGTFWLAYLVGGILFVVSSVFYILETQPNWYTPAPGVLGWWIGSLNLIGSIGWTLSASYGYCSASWCEYQSDLSLIWASIAFLAGSLVLWYEALDKFPVLKLKE